MENLEATKVTNVTKPDFENPDFQNPENWTINAENANEAKINTNPKFLIWIWKQHIACLRDIYNLFETKIELPKDASILTLKVIGDDLNLWFKFNPALKTTLESYTIRVVGTGFETPTDGFSYIDTIIDGMFVWHVFIKQDNE